VRGLKHQNPTDTKRHKQNEVTKKILANFNLLFSNLILHKFFSFSILFCELFVFVLVVIVSV